MTLLKAIVRPDKVDAVREALGQIGVAGMTLTEVRGCGPRAVENENGVTSC